MCVAGHDIQALDEEGRAKGYVTMSALPLRGVRLALNVAF